mgnify:CR=1 FL=1
MIDNAVWYTYAISNTDGAALYLEQKGITKKYTGCNSIEETTTKECTVDGVTRENIWQGKIGLMFASEIRYSNGWLNGNVLPDHSWNMTSLTIPYKVISIIDIGRSQQIDTSSTMLVLPAKYLKENVKIVGEIGTKESPYKLSI